MLNNNKGFSLLELLMALALASMVMAGIYSTYLNQQKSYSVQEQVAAAQQSLRAAIFIMGREIRMAGFDAGGNLTLLDEDGTTADSIKFQMDGNVIIYSLYDSLSDGDEELGRDINDDLDPVAENIDALNFVYLDNALNRLDDTNGDGDIWDDNDISNVKYVEVTIVARTDTEDIDYTDSHSYKNSWGDTIFEVLPAKIHYRRRILRTTIRCRNLLPVG